MQKDTLKKLLNLILVKKEDQECQANIEMAKDEPSYKLMRELDDLKDKYNKLLRD